jgi:hypothetical protein
MTPEEIRTAALTLAVRTGTTKSISEVVTLADLYEVYIRVGPEAAVGMIKEKEEC